MSSPFLPLSGTRVLEFQGAGAVPFCGMLLADLGADVVVVERTRGAAMPYDVAPERDVLMRGKRRVALDLKAPADRDAALALAMRANAVLEGFRPGVMERLGLGPQAMRELRPSLVYARISGFGRDGPAAMRPGHDLNFLANAGALHYMGGSISGPCDVPTPPLNLVADFGAAGTLAAVGVLAALMQARVRGSGQVVDISMLQATRLLMASICSWRAAGFWHDERGTNFLDGSCPWYAVYRAADGAMLAVASLEPAFYAALVRGLGLHEFEAAQWDRAQWPRLALRMRDAFAREPRSHWLAVFETEPACVSAVDPLPDAPRDGWFEAAGVLQPQGVFGPVACAARPHQPLSRAAAAADVQREWDQPANQPADQPANQPAQ